MSKGNRKLGFTLVEALVSVTLLGVGIAAVLGGLSQISRTESMVRDRQLMQRYAMEKLDELIATGDTTSASLSGDFQDRGETRFSWSAEVQATGIEDLDGLVVSVQRTSNPDLSVSASGLVYAPPATTETAAPVAGGGQ